jgi:hypothetical protein
MLDVKVFFEGDEMLLREIDGLEGAAEVGHGVRGWVGGAAVASSSATATATVAGTSSIGTGAVASSRIAAVVGHD